MLFCSCHHEARFRAELRAETDEMRLHEEPNRIRVGLRCPYDAFHLNIPQRPLQVLGHFTTQSLCGNTWALMCTRQRQLLVTSTLEGQERGQHPRSAGPDAVGKAWVTERQTSVQALEMSLAEAWRAVRQALLLMSFAFLVPRHSCNICILPLLPGKPAGT